MRQNTNNCTSSKDNLNTHLVEYGNRWMFFLISVNANQLVRNGLSYSHSDQAVF